MFEETLLSVVSGAAGGALALGGQMLLQRKALDQRVAESLWQERIRTYQELLAAASDLTSAITASATGFRDQYPVATQMQLLIAFMAARCRLAPVASRPVNDAVMDLIKAIPIDPIDNVDTVAESFERTFVALVNAMREDLHIGRLDTTQRLWDADRMREYMRHQISKQNEA